MEFRYAGKVYRVRGTTTAQFTRRYLRKTAQIDKNLLLNIYDKSSYRSNPISKEDYEKAQGKSKLYFDQKDNLVKSMPIGRLN